MSKDNVLTEEIFDKIVSKMVEDTNCPKNYWEMKHQPASPATVRKINQDWEECKKWRKEQEEKMKKRRFFNEN